MAQIDKEIILRIRVDVELTFWQALKLRLAGAGYVEGYVQRMLEDAYANTRED